ncbi:MAG: DNA repair protein RecO [Paludibacteraceae bacterium]
MLAIVLSLQPYSDRAHILHTYTREQGRMNYMVYGLGKKKSQALYAPLSLLDIAVSPSTKALPAVKEAHLAFVPQRLHTDMRRQTVALFIAEVLYRTLRHPMADEALFDFAAATVRLLDCTEQPENIHLAFLVRLAEQLGFAISEETHPELLALPSGRQARQQQLRGLCDYFARHIEGWQVPLSLDILTEVFATVAD